MNRLRDRPSRARRLARHARPRIAERPLRWALSTLALLLTITACATLYTVVVARDDARHYVEREAASAVETIDRRLLAYGEVLVAVRGLFEIDPHPTRARFARFVSSLQLDERYPGVHVVSYARAIDAADAPRLAREVRRDRTARAVGYPLFTVRSARSSTRMAVLDYLEPIAGNEPALGFDLLSDPIRAEAVEITQSTGRPAATAPTRLVQDTANRKAFVFMLAVRNVGGPLTSARTGRLQGVVTAAFEFDDLLDAIIADRARGSELEVYDVGPATAATPKRPARETVIYDSDDSLGALRPGPLDVAIPIDVGGRRWLVSYSPSGAGATGPDATLAWFVGSGGTLASLLASWLLLTLARGRSHALALAGQMTSDLERQRRQLVEAQAVGRFGSWEWDLATDTIELSDELYRIYGLQRGATVSREEIMRRVHPDDRERTDAALQAALAGGEQFTWEHRVIRPDASFGISHGRGEVIRGTGGQPVRVLGAVQDVTELREAEASRLHLAALVDSSEDAIIAKTLSGEIVSWNHGAQELFGYAADEVVGSSMAILVPPERRDELADILARIQRGERVDQLETTRVAKDGRAIDVSLRLSLIHDAAGEVIGASSITRDITRQKLAETQLRRSSRYFELSRDLSITCGFDGYFKSVNPAVSHVLGWSPEEFLSRPFIDMVHPDDRAASLAEVEKLAAGQIMFSFVNRYVTKTGGYRSIEWSAIVARDDNLMYASGRDITERLAMEQALREAEQRFRTAFDGAPIGVGLISLEPADRGRLVQANPALAEILGTTVHDLGGLPINTLTHPADHADIHAHLTELADGGCSHVQLERRFIHRSGEPVWALISAARLPGADGDPAVAVTHVMDISDRKRFEGQLQHLADHDALTGLFNRRRFSEELERALKHAKRFGEEGAVLFLDLDGFKFVNDSLGHAAGDELISRVAGLLAANVRETDILARVGGDEFAVLLSRCNEESAIRVAEKLLATLRRTGATTREDHGIRVSSSIGIALFSGCDDTTADELVVEADIAMYDAKEAGRDRYVLYERAAGRRELLSIRENWNERLRTAIANSEFVLHAQPIVPICSDGTQAYELLLRLPDDHGDLIPPGTFLFNAERFGLIEQIDRWVLREAVRHLHASHDAGCHLVLTVNVSGTTISDPLLGPYVAALLAEHPVPPGSLVIEITETAAITNIERARTLSNQLKSLGCQIALDDFGAGFASFYHLKHLNFDYLKIDGEFVRNLCATQTDRLVIQAVVAIAHGLNARTIAEFVGDGATIDVLRELGVGCGQGYHLGRPAPLDHVLPYLIASSASA